MAWKSLREALVSALRDGVEDEEGSAALITQGKGEGAQLTKFGGNEKAADAEAPARVRPGEEKSGRGNLTTISNGCAASHAARATPHRPAAHLFLIVNNGGAAHH